MRGMCNVYLLIDPCSPTPWTYPGQQRTGGWAVGTQKIVLLDDCNINNQGLATLLSAHDIEAASAWDLPSLLQRLEENPNALIVLNIGVKDSVTLLRFCLEMSPHTRVIVTGLSTDKESEIVFCAEAGAAGLHLRNESLEQLLTLIRGAGEGSAQSSTEVTAILLRHLFSANTEPGPEPEANPLTAREREILALLEQGLSNQQIASQLSVTLHTVKNHVHNVLAKLGVDSRAAAAVAARRMRFSTPLVNPPNPLD